MLSLLLVLIAGEPLGLTAGVCELVSVEVADNIVVALNDPVLVGDRVSLLLSLAEALPVMLAELLYDTEAVADDVILDVGDNVKLELIDPVSLHDILGLGGNGGVIVDELLNDTDAASVDEAVGESEYDGGVSEGVGE